MIVMKFGGSSVRDADRIGYVLDLVEERLDREPTLVFSAMGDTTDNLLTLGQEALSGAFSTEALRSHHETAMSELSVGDTVRDQVQELLEELEQLLKGISLLKECSAKTRDYLVSFGERLSVRIIAGALEQRGREATALDAWELGLRTDSTFGDGEVQEESLSVVKERLRSVLKEGRIPVVTGFLAQDNHGNITTLGRGGSDLSASLLGAALQVEEVQVWKDVDGILTTDPRVVAEAQSIPRVTFEEAFELAFYGAKVLHPLSLQPALKFDIPVRVKNSYNPTHEGTLITAEVVKDDAPVKAISCKREVTLVDVVSTRMLGAVGFLAKVFETCRNLNVSVDMLASSEVSISMTVNKAERLSDVVEVLREFCHVSVGARKAIISIIGDVSRSSEILGRAFSVLADLGVSVQMVSQGASKVNVGFIVEDDEAERCIRALHSSFFTA